MSKLVIVESPAKAKTIEKFLPKDYTVRACLGHVRDLPDNAGQLPAKYKKKPWSSLGVNIEKNFDAVYVVKDPRSKKAISELKKELKKADELILATDEDREGEAISWHLIEALKPKVPVKRMVFHEITKTAIQEALDNTREIDGDLVEAQETRRILDRLVGYPLSLLVAKKIKYGLSAGRVQSPAVYLLVQRERERRKFRRGTYWSLKAKLQKDTKVFDAELHSLNGTRLATGKDFDENTGQIAEGKKVLLLDEAKAKALSEGLIDTTLQVVELSAKPYKSSPKPPFTTSTLQQEASRKLNLSARDTMSIAQKLYENGFITYMRTDSTNLSKQALEGARETILRLYGEDYLPEQPRAYKSKSRGAQEAHEAIRPTGDQFRSPEESKLRGTQLRLYELIWKRTVASQMKDAQKTALRIDSEVEIDGETLHFRSNGNRIDFDGFMRAYIAGSDNNPDGRFEDQDLILPKLEKGEAVECAENKPNQHSTKPPARFTEASLVKKLEEEGIGRPSTYATILSKITDGRYARKDGKALIPTYMAFAVASFLENYFPDLVDLKFTANMENDLDSIAQGSGSKVEYLHSFYRAEGAFADQVKSGETEIEPDKVKVVGLDDFSATLRVARYGAYVQMGEGDEKKSVNIPDNIPPADLTMEDVMRLLEEREKGPTVLGEHPETKEKIFLMKGRFGYYIQQGEKSEENKKPKTGSIPKGTEPDAVTLEQALQALALPRHLGDHPDDGNPVQAGIGRYGAFIKHNKDYRSLEAGVSAFDVTFEQALELLKQPKKGRRTAKVLRELGKDDKGKPINIYDGKYGPYVKQGKTNASLPKDMTPEEITLEQAMELIEAKKAS